jgi:hypothetical protein
MELHINSRGARLLCYVGEYLIIASFFWWVWRWGVVWSSASVWGYRDEFRLDLGPFAFYVARSLGDVPRGSHESHTRTNRRMLRHLVASWSVLWYYP